MRKLLRIVLYSAVLLLGWLPASAQVADFSFTPDSGCAPMVVNFTDLSEPGVTSWNWNFGNSSSATNQNPSTTYSTAGSYVVTLTTRGSSGTSTKTKTVTVFDKPAISFAAASTGGCTPFAANFSSTVTLNGPGPGSYTWDFGDGNMGTGTTASHTYTAAGTYSVALTVSNAAGCSRTVSRTNYITSFEKPVGSFSANQTLFCAAPATVIFTNTTASGKAPFTAAWTYGDNSTGTGNNPTKTYTTSNFYTVRMIVTDANGCADTVLSPNYIGVVGQTSTFTAPAKACVNEIISVSNTTTGAVSSTTWDFGDLKPTSTGNTTTHVYDTSGTFTITMTTVVAGCTKTATKTIIVNPNPAVTIVQSPSIPCPAPVVVTFTGASTKTGYTISNYNWVFKSGGVATGQTVAHNYTANGYDEVKLFTTSADGCKDSVIVDTVAIRKTLMNITPGGMCSNPPDTVAGCNPFQPSLGEELFSSLPPQPAPCTYVPYPVPVVAWKWDFGDGIGTSTAQNPVYRYTVNGSYKTTCVVTTANGCKDSAVRWVHVDSPIAPSFTAAPTITCPKEEIIITNTTALHKPGTKYTYDLDGDTTITRNDKSQVNTRFKKFGFYDVLMISNYRGCIDTLRKLDYFRVYPPMAKFTDSVFCYPQQGVSLRNLSDSATRYLWDFGDGNTSTAANPNHLYTNTGDYTVKLTAYNDNYNCKDEFSKVIHIFKPDITFLADRTAICKGDFVRLEGAFGGTGEIRYSWLIDNFRTGWDTARVYEYQFNTIGYHDITLFAISGNNCLDVYTRNRYVLSTRPTVMFDALQPIGCEPLSVAFSDNSTNVPGVPDSTKVWILGDGNKITGDLSDKQNHIYLSRGIYNPKLIIMDSLGCADSLERTGYIQVYKPTAIFTTSDDSVCAFEAVRFKSFSTGKAPLRFDWDFGDNTRGSADTALHFYTKPGSYHVRLIVTDSVGCADTMDILQDIYVDAPHAAFTMSDSLAICPPLTIQFTNQSTDAISYSWNFDNGGGPVTVKDPVSTFSNPKLYNVYLVATNVNGCKDTARRSVRVLGYAGALTYTPLLGCAPMEVTFSTPIPGVPKLTWDFGDGVTVNTTNSAGTKHTYQQSGAYLPKVIFSDARCPGTLSEGLDTIRVDKLTANFSWSVPCEGVAFTLNDASTGVYSTPNNFNWTFVGTGSTATGASTQFTYPNSGTRQVTLTVTNPAGCTGTITKDVFINASPDLNAMTDTAICPGDTAMLRASNAVTYTWSPSPQNPAAGMSCTVCQNPLVYPGGPATYLVTGVDINGCIGHDSTKVVIQIKTTASTGAGGSICLGETFRLVAGGAQKYEWMPAATVDSPFIASPLATPRATTTYIVAAQEGTCLIDSQRITVIVNTPPDFSAGPDKVIKLGSATTLEPKGNYRNITWLYNDPTLSCHNCSNPIAHPYYTRTYVAEVESEFGCKTRDSVTVFIQCNGGEMFVPNTFTPNGDGQNDYFYPQGAGIDRIVSFRVFTRWGELVFERLNVQVNDMQGGWDGSYKGQLLSPDTYIYAITARCPTGELLEFKGDVTIVR